jgi:hypothetical protein
MAAVVGESGSGIECWELEIFLGQANNAVSNFLVGCGGLPTSVRGRSLAPENPMSRRVTRLRTTTALKVFIEARDQHSHFPAFNLNQ